MAAAAGLHFNLAASLGSAPLTPFGAFGNPFAAAVAPFGVSSRFNGGVGNGRPNGSSGGKPPTTFDLSLAETLGHHHHAAAMAAAAAAAELAAYHHAAQQQQQQHQQQHQAPTGQTPNTVLSPIEPLKLKSDLIITSNKSNRSASSRSSRSSNSSQHSGRSTPPTPPSPPTPPKTAHLQQQHEIVAETQ